MATDIETYLSSRGHHFKRTGPGSVATNCPFHDERTPSFYAYEHGHFTCFGCGAKGDLVDLIRRIQFPDLPEARGLAKAFEIANGSPDQRATPYTKPSPELRNPTPQQRLALDVAAIHYRECLKQSPAARAYLKDRGVDTIEGLPIGYSPGEPRPFWLLCEQLRAILKEAWHETAASAGLIRKDGSERLAHRIVIWERGDNGTIYYQGRNLGESGQRYLAPPNLRKSLLGLPTLAWDSDTIKLVEGPFDALPFWTRRKPAISLLGSELRDSVDLVQRANGRTIQVMTDSDPAGEEAAKQIMENLDFLRGKYARVIPGGKDPNDWVRSIGIDRVLELTG